MAEANFWVVMTIFGATATLAFFFILLATRKLNGPEMEQWKGEMKEWEDSHPIRSTLMVFLPFPFSGIVAAMGTPPPRMRMNEISDSNRENTPLENQQEYVPQVSIMDQD